LLLYGIDGIFWHYSQAVYIVVKVKDTMKHGLIKGIPSLVSCWIETDTIIAKIDNGIENHVFSDHIISHHQTHPDNSTSANANSTSPSYCPSISHLVVFWGVIAHLVVFFLSLIYQCCINNAMTSSLSDADDTIFINDDNNISQSHE